MKSTITVTAGMLGVLLVFPTAGRAQGVILPRDDRPIIGSYTVEEITVEVRIRDQAAEVQVSQTFRNPGPGNRQVEFLFPLPPRAAVSQFTLMVDGREHPAKLYSAKEARRIYEDIVRRRRDPALLEYMGYGLLRTRVFPVPSGQQRKVTLRYTHLCERDGEVTQFLYPLSSGKLSNRPIERLRITVRLQAGEPIKTIYSPSHDVDVRRPDETSAVVSLKENRVRPATDFRLLWQLSEKPVGATLLSHRPDPNEDGYFLLLASPEVKPAENRVLPKTVIFVLDRSGSMQGKKIEQAKGALTFVLNNLRERDTFNIVAYDSEVESFRPELERFSQESRREALRFVENLYAGGSTDINAALQRALAMAPETARPTYVLFLTDGLPTHGETAEAQIAANAEAANEAGARLMVFGVGYDVNARLLDRLSGENSGTSVYVRPDDNIEAAVAKFYGKMTDPVLADLQIELKGARLNRTYPRTLPDLFAGGQLIWVGRYKEPGRVQIRLSGKTGGETRSYEFAGRLVKAGSGDRYSFVEKLWALRRIGEIIDELDLHGRNQELVDELVHLSTKHGIMTPYTSFLADERTDLQARFENARLTGERAEVRLRMFRGRSGFAQRELKQRLLRSNAPAASGAYIAPRDLAVAAGQSAEEVEKQLANVQVVGEKALFRRDNRWIDPSVTPDEEQQAVTIEQFSDRYFELARSRLRLRKFLALPEGCTVKIDGAVYRVLPPKGE